MFSISRKKLGITTFLLVKIWSFCKNQLPLNQWRGKTSKILLQGKTLNKIKLFLLANKSISTSQNEGFCLKKYFFTRREKYYHCQKSVTNEEKNCLPLATKSVSPSKNKLSLRGIFFKNWTPSNFNNDFHQQKESSKIRFHWPG